MNDQEQMMNQSHIMNILEPRKNNTRLVTMEEYFGVDNLKPFRLGKRPTWPSWVPPPHPEEDDSWLDEEIQKEDNERMKFVMIQVKHSMRSLSNKTKREYISDERNRIIELEHYGNDIKTTEGFEVGDYPYLARKALGCFITRYYYPPDITITDFELDQLTRLANEAIALYNDHQIHGVQQKFGNVLVIKAMRSFSFGFTYYLTFEASVVGHPDTPQIFEAQVYVENHKKDFKFVRPVRVNPGPTHGVSDAGEEEA